jgi:hypothetical protein
MAFAQGQFTIVDYNDAITLSGYLTSSESKTQRFLTDSASYLPNWADKKPTITPTLYKAGSSDDILLSSINRIKSITWYANNVEIGENDNYTFITKTGGYNGATLNYQLKIKNNILTSNDTGLEIRCDIVYNDSASELDITQPLSISYSLVRDGGGLVAIEVTTPDGEVFKNNTIQSLQIVSKLWRGSEVDTTDVQYKWAYNDNDVTTTSSTGYDATFGTGWHLIANGDNFTINGNTLTVKPGAVPSLLTIKCAIIDMAASPNVSYIDGVTLVDRSDPIEVMIVSTGGNVFKNGSGTDITLTAKVYQGGVEVSADTCDFLWSQYDKNGNQTTANTTIHNANTQSITVSANMIDSKSTFWCEVTHPKASN